MKFTIEIDLSNHQAVAFLNYIKTLEYIRIRKQENEEYISTSQVKEATKRLKELEKHPEKAIDFDKTIDKLEAKYGL